MTTGSILILAASAAHSHLYDSYRVPDRLVHRYEIECRGRSAAVVLEERLNRSPPSQSVTVISVTPFGARDPIAPGPEVTRIFAHMAAIQNVSWACYLNRASLIVDYVDRQSVERATRPGVRAGSVPITNGRAYFHLDDVALRPEQPAGAGPR